MDELSTKNIRWEPYEENIMVAKEIRGTPNRISRLRETMKVEHLNEEENNSIYDLC